MEVIIEIVNRAQKVQHRQKVIGDVVTFGSAYDNDVILSEPHVSEHHACLKQDEEGRWLLEDLNSTNGIMDKQLRQLPRIVEVNSGDVFSLGKVTIRILATNHPVKPAIELSELEDLMHPLSRPIYAIGFAICLVGLIILETYLSSAKEIEWNTVFLGTVVFLIGISVWPLLCSIMARLAKHEVKVLAQIAVVYFFVCVFLISGFVMDVIKFNFGGSSWDKWVELIVYGVLLFAMFWFNFYLAFNQTNKRRTMVAAGVTCILISLNIMSKSRNDDFTTRPIYDSSLMPPVWNVKGSSTTESYLEHAVDIFTEASASREEDKSE